MGKKSISGIPEKEFEKAASKVEKEIDEGYKILLSKWKQPVTLKIDDVEIQVLRPNMKQISRFIESLMAIASPPKDPKEIVSYMDNIRKLVAEPLSETIVSPRPLNTKEFWIEGDYPFDFLIRVINEIVNIFNSSITAVTTFRED